MVYIKNFILLALVLLPVVCSANDGISGTLSGQSKNLPEYRRMEFSNMLRSSDFSGSLPITLEFHVINYQTAGWRLYENSGDYKNPNNQFDRFGSCGGRVYNTDEITGDYKRDSLGNVLSFLGINMNTQYGKNTNYAFYLDTAYVDRGSGWIKPQYMLAVDPYIPEESEYCDPETGDIENLNGKYVIGRYMYNTSMYAKEVADSVQVVGGNWVYADKYYDETKGEGIKISESATASGYMYRKKNFNKVQPIKDYVARNPNGEAYKHDGNWERLAFAWAIHKGDSLYVLQGAGLEPVYKNAEDDPHQLWLALTKEYGEEGSYVDFDKLVSENIVSDSAYQEAYFPFGDRSRYPEMRTYHDFKPSSALSSGKTIGLHAIIALDDNTHKDWVFSFRLVEYNSDDFVIESEISERSTAYGAMIRPGYGGWIKFQNGVPVITRSDENYLMAEAVVFNVKQTENPVSNEIVNVGEATSNVIVIGRKGSITIFNAAGKNVVVRNLLGQTIANSVISSDKESIAAPSGVAVVVVGNENRVKVIVK